MFLRNKRSNLSIALFTICWTALSLSGQASFPLENFGPENGLSQGYVTFIYQDNAGFLWIGTRNGLNRYDGKQFKVFTHDPLDSFSISGNVVLSIQEWGDFLFLGTAQKGINVFHKKTQHFHRLRGVGKEGRRLLHTTVSDLFFDKHDRLWCKMADANGIYSLAWLSLPEQLKTGHLSDVSILTSQEFKRREIDGLHKFGLDQAADKMWAIVAGKLCCFNADIERLPLLEQPVQNLNNLFVASEGGVWLSGLDGLGRFDGTVMHWLSTDFKPRDISLLEAKGQFLIITEANLLRFNPLNFEKPFLKASEADLLFSAEKGKLNTIYQDRSGIFWMGTNGYGLIKHNPRLLHFHTHFQGNAVQTPIWVDAQGHFGYMQHTWGEHFSSATKHSLYSGLQHLSPSAPMIRDQKGNLWTLASSKEHKYLFCQIKSKGNWTQVLSFPSITSGYNNLSTDASGNIWIALMHQLIKYNPDSKALNTFSFKPVLPEDHRINALIQTADGIWWVGTDKGLVRAAPQGNTFVFKHFTVKAGVYEGIQNNQISSLLADPQAPDVLWIGTLGGGLSRLDGRTLKFKHYNTRSGFPNNVIYGILADDKGWLWMSSNKGIIRLNPENGIVKNYTIGDGLLTNEFNVRAYTKGPDGTMFFGCVEGLVSFNPNDFSDNPVTPSVRLIGLELNNRSIVYGDSSGLLQENIEFTRSIELPYSKNSLTLEFAALEYSNPSKNRFRYYLKGVEQEWAHETVERTASYLNLQPGKYTFFVKACNSDGVWNETATALKITIFPPWYRSPLAYVVYAFLTLTLVYGIFRFFLQRLRLRDKLAMEHREAERLKELDGFKSRLYTNITHEFRTPLTVIQGMAGELANHKEGKPLTRFKQATTLIQKNSAELLTLINQLLDLAKLEAKSLKLQIEPVDLVHLAKYLAGSFESLSATKDIDLHFYSEKEMLLMEMDSARVQTILSNLFSNAIKFTPVNGDIAVQLRYADNWQKFPDAGHFLAVIPTEKHMGEWVSITIRNTGPVIHSEELPYLFDRFYQSEHIASSRSGGTGIGLALVKELVQLLEGALAVQSSETAGTEFMVILPVVQPKATKAPYPQAKENLNNKERSEAARSEPAEAVVAAAPEADIPTLLIIEDNADVLQYLMACVEGTYQVLTAQDGQQGIDKALESVPDIILSDVMMPVKDGFEVVKTLKNDERCSHIPIVLLTAKADLDSRIEGLERGADAYLAKPFDKEELLVWLRKLLESRQKLQERYAHGQWPPDKGRLNTKGKISVAEKIEDAFVRKVQLALDENMSDENFGVHELCLALGMSRTQLHNKIKALTGKSTSLFLRSLRLQKARQLLLTTDKNVSEIAMDVGFRYLQHFSQYYVEAFGEPPSKTR